MTSSRTARYSTQRGLIAWNVPVQGQDEFPRLTKPHQDGGHAGVLLHVHGVLVVGVRQQPWRS